MSKEYTNRNPKDCNTEVWNTGTGNTEVQGRMEMDENRQHPPLFGQTGAEELLLPEIVIQESEITDISTDLRITDNKGSDIRFELVSYDAYVPKQDKFDFDRMIYDLNSQIDLLSSKADQLDYLIAIASGIVTGMLDVLMIGGFDLQRGRSIAGEKIENVVKQTAQIAEGKKFENFNDAVRALEKRFPLASDGNTSDFGGGSAHHLRDFAHHPTLVGLIFSLLTQFTEKSYGTDTAGNFLVVDVPDRSKIFIGKTKPEKIFKGTVTWFFHLVSDVAGSSSTAGTTGGTGLPGPILALAKEMSALPGIKNITVNDKSLSVFLSKLFNGTLLVRHDENGKIIKGTQLRFDWRAELGVGVELGRQALPVIANEAIVRGFYFIRRLGMEMKANHISGLEDMKRIDWKEVKPAGNPTIARMLTISTGVFTTVDVSEAVLTKGQCFWVSVNYVGVGRFAVAVGQDVSWVLQANQLRKTREGIETIKQQTFQREDASMYGRIGADMDLFKGFGSGSAPRPDRIQAKPNANPARLMKAGVKQAAKAGRSLQAAASGIQNTASKHIPNICRTARNTGVQYNAPTLPIASDTRNPDGQKYQYENPPHESERKESPQMKAKKIGKTINKTISRTIDKQFEKIIDRQMKKLEVDFYPEKFSQENTPINPDNNETKKQQMSEQTSDQKIWQEERMDTAAIAILADTETAKAQIAENERTSDMVKEEPVIDDVIYEEVIVEEITENEEAEAADSDMEFPYETDKLGLNLEQTIILYNIEYYKILHDIQITNVPVIGEAVKELKKSWLNEWKEFISEGFESFTGIKGAQMEWYSIPELHEQIALNYAAQPWYRLSLLEAMLFEPYYALETVKDKNGKETISHKYDMLNAPFTGFNKGEGDRYLNKYFAGTWTQKDYVTRLRKSYDAQMWELNEVLKNLLTTLTVTAGVTAVTIATAGAFAGPIAVALVGSNFAGLSGAALTSACLAYIGGGAIAAGGAGMLGGTIAIVGGGAVLGAGVGAGVGGALLSAGLNGKKRTIEESAKLMTAVKEIFLNDEHDVEFSDYVYETYLENLRNIEKGLVDLRLQRDTATGEEKKKLNDTVKQAEESVEAMKIALKSMRRFNSSFTAGL